MVHLFLINAQFSLGTMYKIFKHSATEFFVMKIDGKINSKDITESSLASVYSHEAPRGEEQGQIVKTPSQFSRQPP